MRPLRTFPTELPALCFGNAWATSGREPNALSRLLSESTESTVEHAPRGAAPGRFRHRTAQIVINGLKLTASSSLAVDVHVPEAKRPTLIVPMHGRFSCSYGSLSLQWAAGDAAMLLPARPRRGVDTTRSGLWIDIDPQGLEELARTMVGEAGREAAAGRLLDFEQATLVPLRAAGANFAAVFEYLCQLVDAYAIEPALLARSGLDEAFCRVLVTMLLPHRLLQPSSAGEARTWHARAGLARACEYAHAHLGHGLRVADLERASGLSTSALRRAFRERLGCTPQQWVLEQRLLAAQSMLARADEDVCVSDVARRCFGHVAGFSSRFRQRFGETPERSLQRAQGRRMPPAGLSLARGLAVSHVPEPNG